MKTMAECRLEQTIEVNGDPTMSAMHATNPNESRHTQGSSNAIQYILPNINPRPALNFGATTMECSRTFTDNISSTIEGIRPFIQRATPNLSFTSFLAIRGLRNHVHPAASPNDSYIINLEESPTNGTSFHVESTHNHHITMMADDQSNNMHETANQIVDSPNNNSSSNSNSSSNNNNNNNNSGNNSNNNNNRILDAVTADHDVESTFREVQIILKRLQQYVPFASILLTKSLYDHRAEILMCFLLLVTFIHANNDLKREIAKQQHRSWSLLMLIFSYITGCIVFVVYIFDLHTLLPYAEPLTIWDLLCYVAIMDFLLKLITIVCKILLTCLPVCLLAFQNRGKYYFMVEATSQLYRCVAPVQPWLYYLFKAYQGPEKIVGIFFSVLYSASKVPNLLSQFWLFCNAIWKLFQNMSLGVPPSKEQLIASGGICAICHEIYTKPIKLHCKHIFCEMCVSTWLDRERSCPLCRASITSDPLYRDGHTTNFVQLY